MLKLIIFEGYEPTGAREIAINPEFVETVEDHGPLCSRVGMTSGRSHLVKQKAGERSVRDWLTNASVELKHRIEEGKALDRELERFGTASSHDVSGNLMPRNES